VNRGASSHNHEGNSRVLARLWLRDDPAAQKHTLATLRRDGIKDKPKNRNAFNRHYDDAAQIKIPP
jgi:hypothetical protein